MYKHILIAIDGSELGQSALQTGLALAKQLTAKATAVTVSEPWSALSMAALAERNVRNPVADYEEGAAAAASRILRTATEAATKMETACAIAYIKDRHPAEGIIEAAEARGCDLIVMSSHGRRGVSRALLGSQAAKVVTLSPVAVLVCR